MGTNKTEKVGRAVRLYDSTFNTILKWKGNESIGGFIDSAVKCYVRTLDNGDELTKIRKEIELINERQTTNLGLLCEVLRQAGILNGNGEIDFPKTKEQG